ncbi:hypothetical protein [Flavobacterium hibernum]|uniref:Uncharacterized protein n=1 Tax=Flavobacterium hibernum TaxID=37752 RepID=A0A0D0EJD1_9FLAO|nr:hypothetical protein [Flavobacterium hibernum]KIO50955.1 hypothetical protein IW18_20435 [Flavobacterium hibernum]OXA85198.1 hypothetical protein B0A73_17775 [Flavobacterium hibernum]
MEKIINYKIKDFFQLQDESLVYDYLMILDLLNPLKEIKNPNYKWYKKTSEKNSKTIKIIAVREMSFEDVTNIRENFNQPSIFTMIDSVKIITGLKDKDILNFTITQFYGIISYMKSELIEINNMETNELFDDSFDVIVEAVNAKQRMGKFGVLNVLDSLANGNLLQWEAIEKLPYMTVFTKLRMDNEKNKIQSEIAELQKNKQAKN